MMQRYVSELDLFGFDLVTPNQRHRSQVESVQDVQAAVQALHLLSIAFAVIAFAVIALTIYSISTMY